MSVQKTHSKYDQFSPKWKRVRDVLAGQDEVHAAKTAYLPMLKDQTKADYMAYVMRTPFYGASWRTVAGLLGMLFRKPPEMKTPKTLDPYLEDVSLKGVPFGVFAEEFALEQLSIGFCGILTDFPPFPLDGDGNPRELSIAEAEAEGLRPTMQIYKAEAIRNWRFRNIKNKNTLCQVVLGETHLEEVNEFEQKSIDRFRVLDLDEAGNYRVRVYEVKNGLEALVEGPFTPLMDNKPLQKIPFEADFDFTEPPLIDLIDMNLSHYRTSADYEHGCHFTGLPTPVVSGYNPPITPPGQPPEKLYIGSQSAWVFTDPNAKAEYLEFTGQGLTSLKDNLERKEQIMAVLGAKALATEKAGVEAFKTMATRSAGENSILSSVSIAVSLKLEGALKCFAAWAGSPDDNLTCQLNRDFLPVAMDAPTLTAYMAAWQQGAISYSTLFNQLKRGDIIAADVTEEEEQARIESAPLPAVAMALAIQPDTEPSDPVGKKQPSKEIKK